MRSRLIEINKNYYQQDFTVTNNIELVFIVKNNNYAKIEIVAKTNVNIRIKILSICNSDTSLEFKGTLDGKNINFEINSLAILRNCNRKANFILKVPKGSSECIASEKEEAFLLDSLARNSASVAAFIEERKSNINHSYSSNKINKQELLFLMLRGLNENDAQKLILDAKINNFLATIS